jgi:Zn finger protein HypA/HybF involved in hydrogenase expression
MRQCIEVHCWTHGAFYPKALNFLYGGTGCPKCAGRAVDWVERFKSVHGDKYDYSQFEYQDYKQPAVIVCSTHGEFMQTPDNHYRGKQGCPQCKGKRIQLSKQMSFTDFVQKAHKKHGNKFTYSYTEWTNVLTGSVQVHCTHGVHTQSPVNHLAGKVPCPKCGDKKSRGELEVADMLSIFCTLRQRDRQQIKPKELDIFIPDKNIAIEYHGMYYHAHHTAEDELRDRYKTYDKYMACAAKGIRLITIYESEWQERRKQIIRLLRNAIGATKGKLMARKCQLQTVEPPEATAFFDRYHPQGGAGYGVHYGLYWKGKLVACVRFTFGINDRGSSTRQWTLARYATRINVVGGASRLFKAFLQEHQYPTVKSFSDNRYFSGAMYEQLGFVLEEECKPDYQVWSPKIGLRPKAHYQRRHIPQRISEHKIGLEFDPNTDARTEREMTYLMGCGRIYDCGKKRWVWTAPTLDT